MKKIMVSAVALMIFGALGAQEKGVFEVYDYGKFKLHVYNTNDVMGDASYIVEGKDGLVTLEQPLFKDNVKEYDAYLAGLGKPVEVRIADYHLGGTAGHDYVMPEGMPEFVKGPVYGGMMAGFAQGFGDAIVGLPTGKASEVAFGSRQKWCGVSFVFNHGTSTDFPGASILIGKKVYYTHWAPSKAHLNALQVSSSAALDAYAEEAGKALASGAELFIGGHGVAADRSVMEYNHAYLRTLQQLRTENNDAESFLAAVKKAYPGMPGEEGFAAVAKAIYNE